MANIQKSKAFIYFLKSICLTFLILGQQACSTSGEEPDGENYDDHNIYTIQSDEWQFQATTARDLQTAKDLKGNINFVCEELPLGYYRAMISVCGLSGGGNIGLSYCVFTLDQQFNVVGMMTPEEYYVAERQNNGYILRNADEYTNGIPANFISGKSSGQTRSTEGFHLKIVDSLLDFHKYVKDVSTIEMADWASMLGRIKSGDTKPDSQSQSSSNFAYPILLKYEIDNQINDRLQPVVNALNHGLVPDISGIETVGGKLRVNIGLSTSTESISGNVFGDVACGIVMYDIYDRDHLFPIWYPARDVTDHYNYIEYDNLPMQGKEYEVGVYIINKKYVSPYDSLVMHPDMVAVNRDRYFQTTILPANSITITGISSEEILQSNDQNSTDELIRVKGHASCNMPDDQSWGIGYAWISSYDYPDPDYTPSKVWVQERLGAGSFPGTTKDTDFDILIYIDKTKLEKDYSNFVAKGYLMFFIVDAAGNGIGSSDKAVWTYSRKPLVEFIQASIKDDRLSFKYKCDGTLWFDPEIVVSDNFTYQGNLKWMLPSSYNSILPTTAHSDRVYEVSHSTFSAMRLLFLDKTFANAASVPDYAYIRYDIQGKQHRSSNALKFKAEDVVVGMEPGGPFQDPVEVKKLKITDVLIVP